eukprot:TRINITY_DN32314_c0_g1_i1.p2 TRINITY_DN32314_c0_g1~~TRINITY_DN32314_c0_g1_i1.p2  ORF type:complete len:206 (+),score=75.12 TRINITY_DN32314_c0_g1_i1:90-707(+)
METRRLFTHDISKVISLLGRKPRQRPEETKDNFDKRLEPFAKRVLRVRAHASKVDIYATKIALFNDRAATLVAEHDGAARRQRRVLDEQIARVKSGAYIAENFKREAMRQLVRESTSCDKLIDWVVQVSYPEARFGAAEEGALRSTAARLDLFFAAMAKLEAKNSRVVMSVFAGFNDVDALLDGWAALHERNNMRPSPVFLKCPY